VRNNVLLQAKVLTLQRKGKCGRGGGGGVRERKRNQQLVSIKSHNKRALRTLFIFIAKLTTRVRLHLLSIDTKATRPSSGLTSTHNPWSAKAVVHN
jgi:hypothetical protein